jgi:hypothetical protein
LKALVLPDSLERIGGCAFRGCTGLTELTLPAAVVSIASHAFADCAGLKRLALPDSLEHIGGSAFLGCRGLSALTLPAKVTTIHDFAFRNCTGLTALALSRTVIYIVASAFENCAGLTELALPASLEHIGSKAFSGCTRLKLHLPRSIPVAELVLQFGGENHEQLPQLTVDGVPCPPADVLDQIRDAQAGTGLWAVD